MSGKVTARNKYLTNSATVLQLFFKANNIQIKSIPYLAKFRKLNIVFMQRKKNSKSSQPNSFFPDKWRM